MYILGLSCYYHDASAALVKDGRLIAAAEEERFTRRKHETGFPVQAARYCLKQAGIGAKDLDYVAFYEKPLVKFERVLSQHLETFPKSISSFCKTMPSWLTKKLKIPGTVRKKLGYRGEVAFIPHHLAHSASSYLVSPFKQAAILTVDAVGEWATTSYGYGRGNQIRLYRQINFPHSVGLLYSTVTAYLGFKVNNDEYKVMGLSAYGKPTYYDQLTKIIDQKQDGSFQLDMSYFAYHYQLKMFSKKFIRRFGPPRKPGGPIKRRHQDMAASLQKITEEMIIKILQQLHQETNSPNLCMAGGVALNSATNGKILANTPFKRVFIQPAASDAGTSLGAAFYLYHSLLKKNRNFVMNHSYWGPGFSARQIRQFLDQKKVKYKLLSSWKEVIQTTAQLIYNNNIVGWFQGRMEWGPRALGARSILANPCNPKMKDILNHKVKHREPFRPFAPAVSEEDVQEYFEFEQPVPGPALFMLMVSQVKEDKQKLIPAVTHVDGTGRLQVVQKKQSPLFHQLIKQFEDISGVPVLINTSFNVKGEPIVCTPQQAYNCMMNTGIDYLVMDRFLIKRTENQ